MIPAAGPRRGAKRETDCRSDQRSQVGARDEAPGPTVHLVRLQFSRGQVPDTPGAACAGRNSDLWFSDSLADIAQAKAICQGCPDRLPCLSGAIERRETYGIWGGIDFNRRHHQEDVA